MKSIVLAGLLLIAFANTVAAADPAPEAEAVKAPDTEVEIDISTGKEGGDASTPSPELGSFCFIPGMPPADVKYAVIRKLKVGKGSYGSVTDILPKFAGYAREKGADAIISYTGSQRFGFWPWRMVRPVVRGTAVKWSSPPAQDCAALGGSTLSAILATNKAPTP